jgi:beta-glucosidase
MQADLIVIFGGGNESMTRKAYGTSAPGDLPTLELLSGQKELIEQIAALEKPTCAFVNNGTTLNIAGLVNAFLAVIQCWYLGQEGGYAIIDAIFGDINPSGKLPVSFPRSAGHIPAYYSYKPPSRRGYNIDLDVSPLFPFGYGLSYITFGYSNLCPDNTIIQNGTTAEVRIDIKNTDLCESSEVVEMYIHDDYSTITRPI